MTIDRDERNTNEAGVEVSARCVDLSPALEAEIVAGTEQRA
jgi:hypothetical protein